MRLQPRTESNRRHRHGEGLSNATSQAKKAADQQIARSPQDDVRLPGATCGSEHQEIPAPGARPGAGGGDEAGRLLEQQRDRPGAADGSEGHDDEMQYLQSRLAYMRTFAQVTQVQLRSILDALRQELDQLTELPQGVGMGGPPPVLPQRPTPAAVGRVADHHRP